MQAAQLTWHFGMQIGQHEINPPSLPFESVMGRWIPFVLEDLEDHPAEKTQIRVGKDWILGETTTQTNQTLSFFPFLIKQVQIQIKRSVSDPSAPGF